MYRLYANTTLFYIRNLSTQRFWYPPESWHQSPAENEGWLYSTSVPDKNRSLRLQCLCSLHQRESNFLSVQNAQCLRCHCISLKNAKYHAVPQVYYSFLQHFLTQFGNCGFIWKILITNITRLVMKQITLKVCMCIHTQLYM